MEPEAVVTQRMTGLAVTVVVAAAQVTSFESGLD